MPDIFSETQIPAETEDELRWMVSALVDSYKHEDIARIYDSITSRVQQLLYPIWKHGKEYWEDQKILYNFLVPKIISSPEIVLARGRLQQDLEDFFRKKPAFRWKGLWVKELLDLAINIPLSLWDIYKLVATKAGQFVVTRVERTAYDMDASEHSIQDTGIMTDGHIMSSSKQIFLPFMRFVRTSPDYDHPVFVSLYAYLMSIFDTLSSVFQHTKHPRSQNLLSKLLPLRAELVEIAHMPRPPETLRQSGARIARVWREKRKRHDGPPV